MANTYSYSRPQVNTQAQQSLVSPNEARALVMGATYKIFQQKQKQRSEDYDNAYEKWQAGKMSDETFLNKVREIMSQADNEDERASWESILGSAEHEVLLNKINTESTLIEAKVTSGSMSGGDAANELIGLAELAAKNGDELTSAKLQLAAAQMGEVSGGSGGGGGYGGGGGGSSSDDYLTDDQRTTADDLLGDLSDFNYMLKNKDIPYIDIEEIEYNGGDGTDENWYGVVTTDENGNPTGRIVIKGYVGEVLRRFNIAAEELTAKGADPDLIGTLYGQKSGNELLIGINDVMGWDAAGKSPTGAGNTIEGIEDLQKVAVNYMNDPVNQVVVYDPEKDQYEQVHKYTIEDDPQYKKLDLGGRGTYYVKGIGNTSTSELSVDELKQELIDSGEEQSTIETTPDDQIKKMAEEKGIISGNYSTPTAFKATIPIDGMNIHLDWDGSNTNIPYFGISGMGNDEYLGLGDLIAYYDKQQGNEELQQNIANLIPERFKTIAMNATPEQLNLFENNKQTEALQPTEKFDRFQQTVSAERLQPTERADQLQETAPIDVNRQPQQEGGLKVTQLTKRPSLQVADNQNKGTLRMGSVPKSYISGVL